MSTEKYKIGKKTTDIALQILNLDKTEVVTIDIISNQDFTEVGICCLSVVSAFCLTLSSNTTKQMCI